MPIETVSVSLSVPKQGKDVVDAVSLLVEMLIQKKPIAEFAAAIPALLSAVEGVGAVGEELKSVYNDELAAYLVQKVFAALKGVEVPPVA